MGCNTSTKHRNDSQKRKKNTRRFKQRTFHGNNSTSTTSHFPTTFPGLPEARPSFSGHTHFKFQIHGVSRDGMNPTFFSINHAISQFKDPDTRVWNTEHHDYLQQLITYSNTKHNIHNSMTKYQKQQHTGPGNRRHGKTTETQNQSKTAT